MTTSKWCGEKGVLVAVYVERPKRRLPVSFSLYEKDVIRRRKRKGYNNRRAELLDYARHLRSSASKTSLSTSPILLPLLDHEIPVADKKPKHSSTPNCLDKWKFVIPSFLRSTRVLKTTKEKEKKKVNKAESAATTKMMKALVRKIQVMKKPSLMSQLLKKLQKRR